MSCTQTAKRAASNIGKPYEKPNRIDGGISANSITNVLTINDQRHRLSNWVEGPVAPENFIQADSRDEGES
jgi:hypothetical protein